MPLHKKSRHKEGSLQAASQWKLMRVRFRRHKLAMAGLVMLALMYLGAVFCEFIAPYDPLATNATLSYASPTPIRFLDPQTGRLTGPFVHPMTRTLDMKTLQYVYKEDLSQKAAVRFFTRGSSYKLLGLISCDIHLFGVEGSARLFLFGSDIMGRDLFTRVLYGGRISLSLGLVGVFISFILGCILGGISGYFGGRVDTVIQRIIEFLMSIPSIPIWMAMAAALPSNWPSTYVYFGVTLVLSLTGWTGLARVVRGKFMVLKQEDFVVAAQLMGARDGYIIRRHLIPGFLSYLIVQITISVPGMILGETALSFLGLGIQPPAISWGALLMDAQNISAITKMPWLLIPALFVVLTVLSYNFVGDGLRDAADPYKH